MIQQHESFHFINTNTIHIYHRGLMICIRFLGFQLNVDECINWVLLFRLQIQTKQQNPIDTLISKTNKFNSDHQTSMTDINFKPR